VAQIEVQLAPVPSPRQQAPEAPLAPVLGDGELAAARRLVLERLSPTPVPVDDLVRECQLSPALTINVLLELELAGRLERQPGNLVALL
jgi:DNA processing protein